MCDPPIIIPIVFQSNTKGCIKDHNILSLHKDMRHSIVKGYELAFILVYADPKSTVTVRLYILTVRDRFTANGPFVN